MARKQANGAKATKANDTLNRWNTYDDIPDDNQEAFHHQQDKIALGDLNDKAVEEDDEYGALVGNRGVLDIDDQSVESEAEDAEEDEDNEDDEEDDDDEMDEDDYSTRKATATRAKAISSEEDDDDDEEDGKNEEDAPIGGWGPNKQSYYSTNDLDDLSSDSEMDEDEKRELEIREVKRLQAKSRQGLTEEDFGLGQDTLRLEGSNAAREARRKDFESEALAMAKPSIESLDIGSLDAIQKAELISKVQKSTPETLALVGEYADVVEEIGHVSKRLKKVMKLDTREEIVGLCGLHHQVLLTYAANLAFYFYLRATPAYASNPKKLASHGVIDRLSKLKNGLQILDSFGFAADDDDDELSEEDSESMEGDEDEENRDPSAQFLFRPSLMGAVDEDDDISLGSLEEDELRQLDREEMESEAAAKANRPAAHEPVERVEKKRKEKKPKQKKVAAPLASVAIIQDDEDELGASKKRKKGSSKPSAAATTTDAEAYSAFGEPTQLAASDSADKEARRRSLKFYTGQIDAKDARKAGGSGLGGDSDIPYRDRERSRMAVADANARKSATFNRQADRRLDGDEWGEEDSRDWKDVMDVQRSDGGRRGGEEELDDTDYYDLVASGKKSAKRAKKDEYDELKAAQRVAPDNSLEEGEHRGISRTIEKNRGLTPRRPKANRNPRVKKRIRFEKAQKKLSSKGPVYKGGQGALQGGYSGEQSGINSNVVKSRQFA